MKIFYTYSVKIKHYNHIFKDTVSIYRHAVDFLINVCLNEWNDISDIQNNLLKQKYIEHLCHKTANNQNPKYNDFDKQFYKFPSYLRRGAINEAVGKVSSYKSNLANWETSPQGKQPSLPNAGFIYPCMYRTVMYKQTNEYEAKIKVFIRNTWDWITIKLRKSDVNYINKHCLEKKHCVPILRKRGKEWFLDFSFEENVKLNDIDAKNQTIIAVDLGINTSATISAMRSDGTILGKHFCKHSKEIDSLTHCLNRVKKAQQHGNRKTPKLWSKVKGINHDIAVKTASYIMDIAIFYNADVIVFEHLDTKGKKNGSKKQKLHMWRKTEVQSIVTNKAHRLGMRVSHICAWGTSKFAYDGSGVVSRGKNGGFTTYELCKFKNGKIYNCDLSASYNIGARYFIRELLKSLNANLRLLIEAKVPQCSKRSTCTLSTLISLNAELVSL